MSEQDQLALASQPEVNPTEENCVPSPGEETTAAEAQKLLNVEESAHAPEAAENPLDTEVEPAHQEPPLSAALNEAKPVEVSPVTAETMVKSEPEKVEEAALSPGPEVEEAPDTAALTTAKAQPSGSLDPVPVSPAGTVGEFVSIPLVEEKHDKMLMPQILTATNTAGMKVGMSSSIDKNPGSASHKSNKGRPSDQASGGKGRENPSRGHSPGATRGGSASDGRRTIKRSEELVNTGQAGMSPGQPLNAAYVTPLEEYMRFRRHYKVAPSYRGPIYVAENLMVPCTACLGPVDPISRVPVGKLFFHPGCIRCFLCDYRSLTDPYFQVGDQAVCSHCAEKRDARCVPKEEARRRKMVLGALRGNAYDTFRQSDQQKRQASSSYILNTAITPGVSAPTLSVGTLHNRKNTTRRAFQLIRRQQHYTQNDPNTLFIRPRPVPPPRQDVKRVENKNVDLPRLK